MSASQDARVVTARDVIVALDHGQFLLWTEEDADPELAVDVLGQALAGDGVAQDVLLPHLLQPARWMGDDGAADGPRFSVQLDDDVVLSGEVEQVGALHVRYRYRFRSQGGADALESPEVTADLRLEAGTTGLARQLDLRLPDEDLFQAATTLWTAWSPRLEQLATGGPAPTGLDVDELSPLQRLQR